MVKERLQQFYDNDIIEYQDKWTMRGQQLIANAYAVGLSQVWAERQLENCNYIELFKTTILYGRTKLDCENLNEDDIACVKAILEETKKALYNELTKLIYECCIK